MKAIALRPNRMQIRMQILCLIGLTIGLFVHPLAVFPVPVLLPLFVCPLALHKEKWIAFVAVLMPCIAAQYHGYDTMLCVSLLLPGLLPLLMQCILNRKTELNYVAQTLLMMLSVAIAATSVLLCFSLALGAPLYESIADYLVAPLFSMDSAETFLSQLQSLGVISVSGGGSISALTLLMDVSSLRQLTLSLHLAIESMMKQALPGILMQACLQVGLFAVLRNAKLNRNTAHVDDSDKANPRAIVFKAPSFSSFALAQEVQRVLWIGCFVSYLCMMSTHPFWLQFGLLVYGLFYHSFATQGAAIAICCLSHRHENRKGLIGVMVALSYLMFPMVLFFVGAMDSFFHFRKHKVFQKKEEQ